MFELGLSLFELRLKLLELGELGLSLFELGLNSCELDELGLVYSEFGFIVNLFWELHLC